MYVDMQRHIKAKENIFKIENNDSLHAFRTKKCALKGSLKLKKKHLKREIH